MHVACPHCAALNRVPPERLAERPSCGRCHRPLLPGTPVELAGERFLDHLQRTELPVVVDFWAQWCGPCKAMAPQFAAVAAQLPHISFVKLDTDANPQLTTRFGIRSIPTLALFQGGRELQRIAGAMPAAQLAEWIRQTLQERSTETTE